MYRQWQLIVLTVILVVVVPGTVLTRIHSAQSDAQLPLETMPTTTAEEIAETTTSALKYVRILLPDGSIMKQDLEDYVYCVVLAEMPASFEVEALKSQAIVARTYTLRRINGQSKHSNADICTKAACCQSYCAESDFLERKGTADELAKVKSAVKETAGLALFFNGELIEATYFSCSGGVTEEAEDVWGEDIPYLKSTLSPGEEKAASYLDTVYYTKEEIADRLNVDFTGKQEQWFGQPSYTTGLGVEQIRIGDRLFSGKEVRERLNLRSTAFTFVALNETIVVITRGYGHRVGMSQYGAEAMAVAGNTYVQILSHYYDGIEIKNMNFYAK